MIARRVKTQLQGLIAEYPTVALLGPRQVGKITLALETAEETDSVYLGLESPADRSGTVGVPDGKEHRSWPA